MRRSYISADRTHVGDICESMNEGQDEGDDPEKDVVEAEGLRRIVSDRLRTS